MPASRRPISDRLFKMFVALAPSSLLSRNTTGPIDCRVVSIFTDLDHLHQGAAGLRRPPSPCCIAGAELRPPGRLEEQGRYQQRSPTAEEISTHPSYH